jgi:hypothetical protein
MGARMPSWDRPGFSARDALRIGLGELADGILVGEAPIAEFLERYFVTRIRRAHGVPERSRTLDDHTGGRLPFPLLLPKQCLGKFTRNALQAGNDVVFVFRKVKGVSDQVRGLTDVLPENDQMRGICR